MSPKTGLITIASGESESSALEVVSETLVGIYMPAAWDAADLGFSTSPDGTAFHDIHDLGTALTCSPAQAQLANSRNALYTKDTHVPKQKEHMWPCPV